MKKLMAKFRVAGPSTFFQGAIAASAATFVGHYPWFFVYNYLSEVLPRYEETPKKLARSAVIGFCASAISDTCSNSIRVIKVYKQSNTEKISYSEALTRVVKEDGLGGNLCVFLLYLFYLLYQASAAPAPHALFAHYNCALLLYIFQVCSAVG